MVVEQAKGFLRERLDVTVSDAFTLLRRYARHINSHMSEVARPLMSDPETRPGIIAGLNQMKATSNQCQSP